MEAIGQLAGGVAHDFNNLLTIILGFCELLQGDVPAEDMRRCDVAEIQKAALRAAELTRQLLAFSRKQIIQPTLLDLNAILTDIQPMLRRLIRDDVKVTLGVRQNPARITADRGQVEQVILNLSVNAQDAMPCGGTLTLETANVVLDEHYAARHVAVEPGPYVTLTVTDTGTGMTPQVLARLFEPFFTTKESGKGTGLRSRHRSRYCRAIRWQRHRRERTRPRHGFHGVFPSSVQCGNGDRPPRRDAAVAARY